MNDSGRVVRRRRLGVWIVVWLAVGAGGITALLAASLPPVAPVAGLLLTLGAAIGVRRLVSTLPPVHPPLTTTVWLFAAVSAVASMVAPAKFWIVAWPMFSLWAWSIGLYACLIPLGRSRSRRVLTLLTGGFMLIGTGLTLVGVVGLRQTVKFPLISRLVAQSAAALSSAGLTIGDDFHPNVIAGMLTLVTPLAVVLALAAWRDGVAIVRPLSRHSSLIQGSRLALTGLAGFCLSVLVLTQSRAAWLGVGVAILAAAWLLAGRRARLVGAALLIVALLLVVFTPNRAGRPLLLGAYESWRYTPSGFRLALWDRAGLMLTDFPLTGIGVAHFEPYLTAVYPWTPLTKLDSDAPNIPAHAHNALLHVGAEFGVAGAWLLLCAFIVVSAVLATALRHAPPRTAAWYWACAMLAAWIAHGIFNLLDATVATRTLFMSWFFAALAMVGGRQLIADDAWRRRRWADRIAPGGLLLVVIVTVAADGWARNGYALSVAQARVAPETAYGAGNPPMTSCRAHYFAGLNTTDAAARDAQWRALLTCSDAYVPLLSAQWPANDELAAVAVQTRPDSAAGVFWLAQATAGDDVAAGVALYQRGLALDPRNGRRWGELGLLLRGLNDAAALEALTLSCRYGDPPESGCRAAGELAADLGDTETAATLYQMARRAAARDNR